MKKLTLLYVVFLSLTMTACSQNTQTNQKQSQMKNKTLVAYFSATGTTAIVAKDLASIAEADLHEITPEKTYTKADLNWNDKRSRSSVEMANKNSRPAITAKLSNMDDYQTVYVGFPIWWDVAPTIINTFLESYDFSGKTIFLFATSGGSSIENAVKELKITYPNIQFKGARLLNHASKQSLQEFCGK